MLDPEERRRRIVAARTLRNLTQVKMDKLGHEHGLGKGELSRLERKNFGERFTDAQAHALREILRVPVGWFSEESVDVIVGYTRESIKIENVADALRRLAAEVDQEQHPDEGGSPPGPDDKDPPEEGSGGGGA